MKHQRKPRKELKATVTFLGQTTQAPADTMANFHRST
jgi:hypothetical protein